MSSAACGMEVLKSNPKRPNCIILLLTFHITAEASTQPETRKHVPSTSLLQAQQRPNMDTFTKAIWGESKAKSEEEPVAGEQGDGTASHPYDKGNEEIQQGTSRP